jgi:hypothetical protein
VNNDLANKNCHKLQARCFLPAADGIMPRRVRAIRQLVTLPADNSMAKLPVNGQASGAKIPLACGASLR